MINTILEVLKTSVFISLPIVFVILTKDKILNKYTYKLNYILCIIISLRMLVIYNIEINIPLKFINEKILTTNEHLLSTTSKLAIKNGSIIQNSSLNSKGFLEAIFIIWVVGALFFIFKNIYNQILFNKKMENISYDLIDKNTIIILDEVKKELNINQDVTVKIVDGISSPALINIIKTKIIIPNNTYEHKELKWIFRHELTHLKRHDNFFKFVLMIGTSTHWFNPIAKKFNNYFYQVCELSCDEDIIKKSSDEDIKEYALTLVNSLKYRNTLKASMLYSQFNSEGISFIKRRVEGMINKKNRKNGKVICLAICSMMATSILSFNIVKDVEYVFANESKNTKNEKTLIDNKNTVDNNTGIVSQNNVDFRNMSDEELKNHLLQFDENNMEEEKDFYSNRKLEDLTQEEIDYALSYLFNGKCKVVNIGSDSSSSINYEYLRSNN